MPGAILGGDADRFEARLARLSSPLLAAAVGKSLVESAEAIKEDIRFNMNDGAISGKGHIPSEPGSSPLSDTHALEQSVQLTELLNEGEFVAISVTEGDEESPQAAWLELGTSSIAERPHMRPAVERARPSVRDGIVAAVNKVAGTI